MEKDYQYDVMLGLKDKFNYNVNTAYDEAINEVRRIMCKYKASYSLIKIKGGYLSNKNSYIIENAILLTFISYEESDALKIAKHLKEKYNQEEILIVRKEISSSYE